jgi:L-threonylcarbamoyladenylate synthase
MDDHAVVDARPADPEHIAAAAEALRRGGLVAFPTETVYGLGADATDGAAVARIFEAKGRPTGHPVIVHLAAADVLDAWALDPPPAARLLADAFWPGPLTMILRRTDRVADAVTGGRDTVGLRVPDHPVARALLEAFGGGVAAPSANRFGRVSPTRAADVVADLGDVLDPTRDLILDGGPCTVGVESTIVDLTGPEPEILRPGGVGPERLADVLGRPPRAWTGAGQAAGVARAPGMLRGHYAPSARIVLVDEATAATAARAELDAGRSVGVLGPRVIDDLPPDAVELEPAGTPDEYAHLLYGRLRQADRLGLDVLLVVPPAPVGVGVAVVDRLRRAAHGSADGSAHGSAEG